MPPPPPSPALAPTALAILPGHPLLQDAPGSPVPRAASNPAGSWGGGLPLGPPVHLPTRERG